MVVYGIITAVLIQIQIYILYNYETKRNETLYLLPRYYATKILYKDN